MPHPGPDCNTASDVENPGMWDGAELIEALSRGLTDRAQALDAENAVAGLDSLPEIDLHPILENSLAAGGLGVFREVPYPGRPRRRTAHRERERCDLVLTHNPQEPPADPVIELKEQDKAAGTLFEPLVADIAGAPATPIDRCYWLEVKVVGQFTYTEGLPGPNQSYASELTRGPASDLAKLARDGRIVHAGVLLVLFTADESTAEHDLAVTVHRMLDHDLPIASPSVESFPINDRIGNTVCTAALLPLRAV